MTLNEVYWKGKNILTKVGIEAPAFDVMCIFEFCFNLNRQQTILFRNNHADEVKTAKFFNLVSQRANGRPLQYILGYWNFMGSKFKIGEGALIPRDDTEVLVKEVLALMSKIDRPKILDLCAGPGTVSIILAKNFLKAEIVAVELSSKAMNFLKENLILNNIKNVTPIELDIICDFNKFNFKDFDIIVSNPPYIPTQDLKSLQKEVQQEPQIALDGGNDGLKFYRAIAKNWVKYLKNNGYICLEVGVNQVERVKDILESSGLKCVAVVKDINGISRAITAKKVKHVDFAE